ncbi:MAG: hypothetical protein PHX68_02745 [Alphaproteobacteria bacterium]|nr:hypothetical protein [Alphaproteobacteria bacterium]
MVAELKKVAADYKVGIDFALLSQDSKYYGFKPDEIFTPTEPPRQTNQKDELWFQECFGKMTDIAEKFGLSLDLIQLTSNIGSKMILGTFEAYKKYGEENAKTSRH